MQYIWSLGTELGATMPVSVSFEAPARFILTGTGRITGAESVRALNEVLAHPDFEPGTTLLALTYDVTGAPPTDELREIVVVATKLRQAGMNALVIVTEPGFVYGVARMFASLADLAGVQVEVFQDACEARKRFDEISARAA
jgi:hypothetical protein